MPKKYRLGCVGSGMKTCPSVRIVIANWNGRRLLGKFLIFINNCTDYPNFKVIVIDDGSTDGSVEMIRQKSLE